LIRAGVIAGFLAFISPALAEPTVLRYACMDGAETLPRIRKIVQAFEQANPDIRIDVEPTTDEYNMKLLTQVAAGVAPDLAWMNVALVPQFADRGVLLPLDSYIAKSPDLNLPDYYPNVVSFYRRNQALYALPRDVAPFGLIFYNKKLFRDAGLNLPDGKWTWSYGPHAERREQSFNWVLQELTRKNSDGKTVQWALAPAWPQLFLSLLMATKGLEMWDSSAEPKRITAADPEVVRVMDFATDLIVKKNYLPTWYQLDSVAQSSAYDEFVKRHAAMLMTFAGDVGKLRRDMAKAGFDWDVTLFPAYEGRRPVTTTDSGGTVIFRQTRHPEAAWRFAKWMSGEPGMREMAKAGLQPANRKLVLEPGVWLPKNRESPANLAIADRAALAMSFSSTPEYFEESRVYLDSVTFEILSGTRSPEETLKRVQREVQIRLDRARRQQPTQAYPVGPALIVVALALGGIGFWLFRRNPSDGFTQVERREGRVAIVFLAPLLVGILGFTLGPVLYSFLLSFSNSDNIRPPLWRGAMNYVDAVTVDPVFLKSFQVTFTYAAMSVPLNILFALGLAVLLNQPVKGIPLYRALFYIPSLVSGVAASLIWMRVFNPESGILNSVLYWPDGKSGVLGFGASLSTLAGTPGSPVNWLANERTALPALTLMGTWGAGASTILFLAGLQGISPTYHEAALLDGASPRQRFSRITVPLLSPTLFFAMITGTIGALQAFTQSFVMTQGGPNNATMFYMLNLYLQGFKALRLGYASALAWILFAIILVLTAIQLLAARKWVHYEGDTA
jgi:ABC-type sugar transport system permease subunit/ABC-type glycerol-3-phosphate transport system substrate-binding protein